MPRPRRAPRIYVDLAGLMERAQQHQTCNERSSHVLLQPSADPVPTSRTRIERSRSRIKRSRSHIARSRQNSRRNTAIWTTAVYPISILERLPFRRGMRQRRSYRNRSRRSQRTGAHKNNGGATNKHSRARLPTGAAVAAAAVSAEVEMPCCATESPTAETQLQLNSKNTDFSCQQPSAEPIFTPPMSTVILHHNPLFDVEGKTQSGLIGKHIQMATIDQAKSRWQIRREKVSKTEAVKLSVEQKDAEKKKSRTGVEKKVPAKKGSGSELSSNASNSTTLNSAGSSEKSKSDTDESHSYEESIDLTTESVGVNTTVMNLHRTVSPIKRRLERNASKAPLALHNATEPKQLRANASVGRVLESDGVVDAGNAHITFDTMLAK